ncbi:MAG: indolepyruvate ferredoxin oxidoreductase family protein, partial [Geminicoccaceae bacterium]
MHRMSVSLDDKYIAERGEVLIGGIQALVRLPLDQIRRDRRSNLRTAGFISGYRGSPLGGYDQQLARAKALLDEHGVHAEPGINEDLAATAVWGSQQVNLHPGARVDGVFGLWYGKGPGVDRTGDVFRHANMAGTSPKGGVIAIAGDDPLAKSSSLPCQSEFAFVDAEIPVLTPSDIQDILDLGLHGIAMSRHSGLWTGMIALADLMDGSATVNVDPNRLAISTPECDGFERHITLKALQLPHRQAAEGRLRDLKIPAALDYARANRLNRVVWDSGAAARLGIAVSGKNWQAMMAALDLLGVDERRAERLGLRLMKISMPWPLEPESAQAFARGLETILVIEAKRPLIETQLKDQLYHLDAARRPAVLGKRDRFGAPLLPEIGDLSPMEIAPVLLKLLPSSDETKAMRTAFEWLQRRQDRGKRLSSPHPRTPHYCSGCPHSRSTRVPVGSRAMAGIGCHIMTQLMGGEARGFGQEDGYSQMGGEGVAWLGQAPFTEASHVFVNLGDGTYHHSGLLAIRAAVAAKATMTYKILFNDAVAMTGGQAVDGPLSVGQIARQVRAEGVQTIAVVSEDPDRLEGGGFPEGVTIADRDQLLEVQEKLRETVGVSVLIFDQTCAAEKRRRRKKGQYPKAKKLAVINDRVCEGCGDCSLQSNCPSVEPL